MTWSEEKIVECTFCLPGTREEVSELAGEMEGLGLLSLAPRGKPNWMIVKGICDFADHQQENEVQANRKLA